jgi:hypothetical protein
VRARGAAAAWIALALAALASGAAAEEPLAVGDALAPFELDDQHGESRRVDESVRAIVLSRDMQAGDVVEAALAEDGAEWLARHHAVYMADISRMPKLVTRMFALPGLRRRRYPMLLDMEGELSARFPSAEGRPTVLRLDAGVITSIQYADSAEALRAAVEDDASAAE